MPLHAGQPIDLVLLDRSEVRVQDVMLEKGMLACTLKNGKKLILSVGLIDWEFTKRTAPAVYAMACPDAEKRAIEKKLEEMPDGPEKSIVITNEDLDALEPYDRDAVGWVQKTPTITDTSLLAHSQAQRSGPVIETIGRGGSEIDIENHLEREKYVLFDFYASWCGPCRKLTPQLESLVRRYPDHVALKKIDIVRWGTPVTRQYRINSVPHVKLYNPSGRKIREGNGFAVLQQLESLSQSEGW